MGYDITPSENENIVMTIAVIGTRDQVGLLSEARPPKERIAWSQVIEIAEDDDFAKGLSLRFKGPLESTRLTKLTFLAG